MPTAVALRPRAFSELFDAAFQLTREHFPPLAVLSAVMALPGLVFNVANLLVFGDPDTFAARGGTPDGYYVAVGVFGLAAMCWFFVMFGAMVGAASDAYMGERVDAGESLRRALSRRGALIGGNVLAYLHAVGPALVLGVAFAATAALAARRSGASTGAASAVLGVALFAAVVWGLTTLLRYTVVSAATMLEGLGAVDAARRSRALSRGSVKRIFGLAVILFVISMVIGLTTLGAATAIARNPVAAQLLAGLVWIPLYPTIACVVTVLYYDLRIRRDGFDVEYAARQLGGEAAVGPAVAH